MNDQYIIIYLLHNNQLIIFFLYEVYLSLFQLIKKTEKIAVCRYIIFNNAANNRYLTYIFIVCYNAPYYFFFFKELFTLHQMWLDS